MRTTLVVAVAISTVLIACGQKEQPKPRAAPAPAATAQALPKSGVTVTIAHAGPLTGSIAHLGKDDENGVALAIAHANAQKLTIGGKPVTFRMMSEDDHADPKMGTIVAQKLVDAKVNAVIGHLNSGVTIPASEIYSKAGIPVISGSATNPTLTERGLKAVFRTVGRDDQQGPAIASYIANELKGKKVVIVDDKTAYGEGLAKEVESAFKGMNIAIVGRERTTDKESDFRAILTSIKSKNPDVIFYGGMDATGGPLLKQARELGINATFAFGDGACTDEMGKLAGAAAEGLICSQAGLPREATSKEFVDEFSKRYGQVKQYAPYFYDATNAVIEAMKAADSTDPAVFGPAMANVSFTGVTGKVEFDEKGDRRNAANTIFELKSGRVTPVAVVKGRASVPFENVWQKFVFEEAGYRNCPQFPTPPPQPSAAYEIPRTLLVDASANVRLGDIFQRITNALDSAGYTDRRYFCLVESAGNKRLSGFVLATRIEKINEDGTPKPGDERWVSEPSYDKDGLWALLKRLVMPSKGYFRIILFVVTDQPLKLDGSSTKPEMQKTYSSGSPTMPRGFFDVPFSNSASVVALVYEFEQTAQRTADVKVPGRLQGRDHLTRGKIMSGLDQPR